MKNTGEHTINNRERYFTQETIERYEKQKESERIQHNKRINKQIVKLRNENERIHNTLVRIQNNMTHQEKEEHRETIQNLMYKKEVNYNEIEKLKAGRRYK